MTAPEVVVYGATGTLVARALRGRGVAVALAGRDPERLAALSAALDGAPWRTAAVDDAAALAAALEGAKVVVSCAGPFTRLGEPVLRAAIAAGAHYLDTTGEQAFMKEVYERHDSPARKRGVCAISAFAFEVALGDWAAELAAGALAGGPAGCEVEVSYLVERFRTTRGTRRSAFEAMTAPGYVWQAGRWDPATAGAEVRTVSFPAPWGTRRARSFPSGEIITVPRHVDAARVQTYLVLAGDSPLLAAAQALTPWLAPLAPMLARGRLGALARSLFDDGPAAPSDDDRAATRFAVVAEARRGFSAERVTVVGRDPYGLTAEIVAWGVERLRGEPPPPAGVETPSALGAAAGLEALAGAGLIEVTRSF